MQDLGSTAGHEFNPQTLFDKWAVVEVERWAAIPEGMEKYELPGGDYAVFVHKGPVTQFAQTAQYIFGKWLPLSVYALDARPQFEILKQNYRPMDLDAEEEVWVPIRSR